MKVPGEPTLGSELKRFRDGFFHYFNREDFDPPLIDAMERAADMEGAYVIREHTMRAEYADEIANKLMHPWPDLSDEDWTKAARKLHGRIAAARLSIPLSARVRSAEGVEHRFQAV